MNNRVPCVVKCAWQSLCGTGVSPVLALSVAAAVGCAFTASADIPASAYVQRGLIAQWDGIENAGAGMHDANAATWVDLVSGTALTKSGTVTVESDGMVFNGSSYFTRDAGTFPADSVFPWTAEVHFKVNSLRSGDNHVIGTNGNGGWSFLQANGKSFAFVPRYGSSYQWAYDSKSLAAGDEITVSGISDTSTIALYKDGALAGSANVSGAHNNGASTVAFKIGTSGTSVNGLIGKVYSARIYDRVLSADEIAFNAAIDKARFAGASEEETGVRHVPATGSVEVRVAVGFDAAMGAVKANDAALESGAAVWHATDAAVTLTATAADGYCFTGWTGVAEGMDEKSPTLTVSTCCPLNLTANFIAATKVENANGVTAKSYVQDGLLAMWDGIENVGYGYHSNTADTWINLSEEGSVWDMQPTDYTRNEGGDPYYQWYDNSCYIFEPSGKGSGGVRSKFLVNHADASIRQMEVVAKPTRDGALAGTNPDGNTWVFGYINGNFYPKANDSNAPYFSAWTNNKFYSHSATLGSSITVYRNEEQLTVIGNKKLGVTVDRGTSMIGGTWTTANAYIHNTRFYSKTLSDAERKRNWIVDQVRFNGGDIAVLLAQPENAAVKAFVVKGEPAAFNASSVPYGYSFYDGTFDGTVSLSGEMRTYDDGVTALASTDDPDHARALCHGYTLSVDGGEETSGSGTSVAVQADAQVRLTWKLTPQAKVRIVAEHGTVAVVGEKAEMPFEDWLTGEATDGLVAVRAVPDAGYAFSHWESTVDDIACPTEDAIRLPVVPRTLTAVFVESTGAPVGGLTARSYVRKGLVAHFDGIENAGYGQHRTDLDKWIQLEPRTTCGDLLPKGDVPYSIASDAFCIGSQGNHMGIFTNDFSCVPGQVEMILNQPYDMQVFGLKDKYVLGQLNGRLIFYHGTADFSGLIVGATHMLSVDYTGTKFYKDNQACQRSTGYNWEGAKTSLLSVGHLYDANGTKKEAQYKSIRIYNRALSDGERTLNYAVDSVRYLGADFAETFCGEANADIPAVVVTGDPYEFGYSSVPYGVNAFDGSFAGTLRLSGAMEYPDGVVAYPGVVDPERVRATCAGGTLKVGGGEATPFSGTTCTVPESSARVNVVWTFAPQYKVRVSAAAGGKVRVGASGELVSSFEQWYEHGSVLALTAVADEGYVFQCWAGDVGGLDDRAAAVTVPNDRLRTLTAVFVKATRVVPQDGFTAKSYVRRGLVAQWDGKENVAYGAFDYRATYWRQLIGQSGHHDLHPNAAVRYSWVDDALLVDDSATGALFTNDATTVIGAVECNASLSANAMFWSSKDKSEPTCHLLGYANQWFYINGTGSGYDFSDLTHQHTYSADFTGARALYVDDVQRGTKGTCTLGATEGITQLGRVYGSGKPKVRSLRYYAQPLTADERRINYGIDLVRFHGQGVVETFGSPLYDDVPIIVLAGEPVCNGVSSVPYGVTVYEGASTNVGAVTLAGLRQYEDGTWGFPGAFDPDRARAAFLGYRYKVGDGAWIEGMETSCDLGTVEGRAILVWKFGAAQSRTEIQAKEGGSVRFRDGSGLTAKWTSIDTVLEVVAEPSAGYIFHHWEVDGRPLADNRKPELTFVADGGRTLVAVFARGQQLSWDSYVQHGLAAQYDGEFNAIDANGTPYHDPAATTWKQLVTTSVAADATVNGNKSLEDAQISWGEKSANFAGSGQFIVRDISSKPDSGGGGTNSWFGGACARAARGIEGVSTEYCGLLHDGRENASHVRTANATVYNISTSYSSNDKGTECMSMYLCNRNLSSMYATSRSTNEWDLSYSLNVQPDDRLFRFYRNGKLKKTHTSVAVDNYYSNTYLQYFLFGRKTLDMHAFRVYTNTLDTYEIRWNSTVDRIRFLDRHPGDVTIDMSATTLGTSNPAAGSTTTLQHGDAFTATLTPTEPVETYDDGVVAQPMGDAERVAVGWRMLAGGPVPEETKGNGLTVSFTATNVLSQIDWTTNTQYLATATALAGEDGQVHGTFGFVGEGVVVTQGAQAKWADAGGTVKLVSTPEEGYRVKACTVTTAAGTVTRRKSELTLTVDGPVTVTVEFEKKPGVMIFVR